MSLLILEQKDIFMKRNTHVSLSALMILMILPGCGRIVDWGKGRVSQGADIKKDLKVARDHIRSNRIYDQFTLAGSFDSLWLSDAVRSSYVELYAARHGKTDEASKVFLRRQLEENNHFISFYILTVAQMPLGEANSEWTVFLKIGENIFTPVELKSIELAPEYEHILGKKLNRFKIPYLVRFNAKDIDDHTLVQPTTEKITLIFRSLAKELEQDWFVRPDGTLKPESLQTLGAPEGK